MGKCIGHFNDRHNTEKEMTIRMLLIAAVLCMHVPAMFSETPIDGRQEKEAVASLNASAAAIKTIDASFTQVKSISLLNDKLVAQGKLLFSAPDCLRWEYTKPYRYTFIMNGHRVKFSNSRGTNVVDLNTAKLFRNIADIIMQTVTGRCLGPDSRFRYRIYPAGADMWKIVLTPKDKQMAAMFSNVTLKVSRKSGKVHSIEIKEKAGDVTEITFNTFRTGIALPAQYFKVD